MPRGRKKKIEDDPVQDSFKVEPVQEPESEPESEPEPVKRRKRRVRAEVPELTPENLIIVRSFWIQVTAFIARRAGPEWKATETELDQLSGTTINLILKWLPFLSKYQEEFAFLLVVALYASRAAMSETISHDNIDIRKAGIGKNDARETDHPVP